MQRKFVGSFRVGRSVGALVLVVSGVLAFGSSVGATSSDAVTTVAASLNVGGDAVVNDVSCSDVNAIVTSGQIECAAVGTFTPGVGGVTQAFVSIQTAAGWQDSPVAGSTTGVAVSCSNDGFCVATGTTVSAGVTSLWVEQLSGSLPTVTSVATDLSSTHLDVTSLSCSSASSCALGGSYTDAAGATQAFMAVWNGTAWQSQEVAQSLNQGDASVTSVSCASDGSCTAVGYANSGFNLVAFAAQEVTGVATTVPLGADLPASGNVSATSVACSSASSCVAGGSYVDVGGNQQAFVGTWNGTTWTDTETGGDLNVAYAGINAVTCADATDCFATGFSSDANGNLQPFVSAWHGTTWSDAAVASGLNTGSWATGSSVSCSSSTSCVVSGTYSDASGATQAFYSYYDGLSWSDAEIFGSLNLGGLADASAATCDAAQCVVGGSYTDASNNVQGALQLLVNQHLPQTPLVITSPSSFASTSIQLSASGGSGVIALQWSSTTKGCVVTGSTLSIQAPGTCLVTVTNPANGEFGPTSVTGKILFSPLLQKELVLTPKSGRVLRGHTITLHAQGGSGSGRVSFHASGPGCVLRGSHLTARDLGRCRVFARKAASGVYVDVRSAVVTFTVVKK